jgi:ADP-dependent NAD(P)H-hydrate dehydratase / NAD(P)H-hydrate epimerase
MKIVSVEQMRALESAAFAAGTSELALQQRAGRVVAEEALRLVRAGEHVVVLLGHGNNGRDGAVAAGRLLGHGVRVTLVLTPRHAVTALELGLLQQLGAQYISSDDTPNVQRALEDAQLGIDALAGIGVRGALRDPLASLVRELNTQRAPVLALDVPSGIDADSGDVAGDAVNADLTVTLGAVKQGLLRFPAAERVGRLVAREIGIPTDAQASLPYDMLSAPELSALVPPRPLGAHKYRFGRVLVLAGSDHFLGAPVMCSGGALRVGAGLVTVASTRDVRMNVAAQLPEATFSLADISVPDDVEGALRAIAPYLQSHTCTVLGPGLGRSAATTEFVRNMLRTRPHDHGLVIDADGLFALAEIADWPSLLGPHVVLTPHSGELERLAGRQCRDWEDAGALAREWHCVLVAKGAFTSIANTAGDVAVWPRANPALATGGTGDVLAGMCAGLLAQSMQPWDAARLAVGTHALAAERIVQQRGWRTLLATDLLDEIPAVLAVLAQS